MTQMAADEDFKIQSAVICRFVQQPAGHLWFVRSDCNNVPIEVAMGIRELLLVE